MTDVFEMPNNAENYYRKAVNLLEQRQYIEAADLMKKSFLLEPNFEIFEELIQIYLSFNKHKELQDVWQMLELDSQEIYGNRKLNYLYGLSIPLLFDRQTALLELYRLKEVAQANDWESKHIVYAITDLNEQVLFEKTLLKANSEQAVEQFIQQLLEKGHSYLAKQIKTLSQIPIETSDAVIRRLLLDSEVAQYLKTNLLHSLIRGRVRGQYDILWFGQERSVFIEELMPYQQYPLYQQTLASIADYCDLNNPHLYEQICQQFDMHAMSYFPFLADLKTDGQEWLDIFLVQNGMEDDLKEPDLNQELLAIYMATTEGMMRLLSRND